MGTEHVVTLEQLVNILASLLTNAGTGLGLGFLGGVPGTGFPDRTVALTSISAALNAIALLDITTALPGITSAVQVLQKPTAIIGGQPYPGVGCVGFKAG
jgi:uncharacterized membrane protein